MVVFLKFVVAMSLVDVAETSAELSASRGAELPLAVFALYDSHTICLGIRIGASQFALQFQ
jgi:hypothetical protein